MDELEITDEVVDKIADKVLAAIATKQAEAEAAAAAEAEATADQPVGDVHAEATQIVDACAIAGVPEKAGDYLRANKSLADVMADLRKTVAASGGRTLNTRNEQTPSGEAAPELDAAAINAKWNAPRKRR